jgi:hypothetical protein
MRLFRRKFQQKLRPGPLLAHAPFSRPGYYNPGTEFFDATVPLSETPPAARIHATGWGLRCGDDGFERSGL